MKKLRLTTIIKIIYSLLVIGGVITFLIVYKNIDSRIATKFVVAYILFLFLAVLYMIGMSLYSLNKLKWLYVKKRVIRFVSLFVALSILGYSADYFFMPDKIDLFKNISIAFGISFATNFFDLIFFEATKAR